MRERIVQAIGEVDLGLELRYQDMAELPLGARDDPNPSRRGLQNERNPANFEPDGGMAGSASGNPPDEAREQLRRCSEDDSHVYGGVI